MKVEAIKKDGHFIVSYFDKIKLEHDKIEIEFDENVLNKKKKTRVEEKSATYKALEKAVKKSGGNDFLKLLLKNTPKNYTYYQNKPDNEILYEALREKYEF